MRRSYKILALTMPGILVTRGAIGAESIEFVAEHLAEIAMDNRYASLPIWAACGAESTGDASESDHDAGACFGVTAGYAQTHSGSLSLDGPMLAFSASWAIGKDHRITAFSFLDDFKLASGVEHRPLEVTFAAPPLTLPAESEFTGLDGAARDIGLGAAYSGPAHWSWLPWFEWSAGVLWQRFNLSDYRFHYLVLEGPDAGATGTLDYSATYSHITPFFGAAWPRARGAWRYAAHFQAAVPLPRHGVEGHITGPGFDLAGSTADNGDKPFGDPSLTIGFNLTYEPWDFTVDLGSTITQALLESKIHEGVSHNLMLSMYWTFD